MTGTVCIVVAGVPIPKGSWIPVGKRGKVRPDNKRSAGWSATVGWAARAAMAGRAMFRNTPLVVDAVFYLPAPKRPDFHIPAVKPDADKLARLIGDALEGIVFDQDSRIAKWTATKQYATHQPGAVITVREWADATDRPTVLVKEVG